MDGDLRSLELFGGAVQLALPQRFTDVASVRPVPDNQEVCTYSFEIG